MYPGDSHNNDANNPYHGMEMSLKTSYLGRVWEYHRVIDSTNRRAGELARKGLPQGTVVIAEEQAEGRGRLQRPWHSPRGGIWFSLVLRPPIAPGQAPLLTLLTALGIIYALEGKLGVEPMIKWPNDIFLEGRKLAGILTEMDIRGKKINHVVVGVGINANLDTRKFPGEFSPLAVSLMDFLGHQVSCRELLAGILYQIEILYFKALENGYKDMLRQWERYDLTYGRRVKVEMPREVLQGEALGVNEKGHLILQISGRKKITVAAGSITLLGTGGNKNVTGF